MRILDGGEGTASAFFFNSALQDDIATDRVAQTITFDTRGWG